MTPVRSWELMVGKLLPYTLIAFANMAVALMVGTAVLMSSIAFSFQRYFEYQIQEAMKISQ